MKVLIVDDSMSMRMISTAVVSSLGHAVTQAETGEKAIELCLKETFNLILMDVEMPGMNGFDTTTEIRRISETWFPIIFLSAKTDSKFFVEGIHSGGDIYLFKPVIPEVLEAMIKAMERIALIQDELHSTKIKMELLAHQDQLTGLVNRRGFDNAIELEIQRSHKEKTPLTLMMMDVDQFKPFNDNYGHQEGDACLQAVSNTLKEVISRPDDIVARYGGEEFSVILPNTNADHAGKIGLRIAEAFKALAYKHEFSRVANYVTVSGGIAQLSGDQSAQTLIKAADDALYRAKENGRNQFA